MGLLGEKMAETRWFYFYTKIPQIRVTPIRFGIRTEVGELKTAGMGSALQRGEG